MVNFIKKYEILVITKNANLNRAVVAELVRALSSLELYTILKGRGFESGHCRSDKNELCRNYLITI